MMKSSRSILLLILISLHPTAYADCPDCYRDQQPLDPVRGYSADGRVKIVVGIAVGNSAESWANPPGTTTPDPRLAAAAGQGMAMWNNATDSQGQKTNYYFSTISGTQPVTNVNIVIVKRPLENEEGEPNPEGEMETGGGRPFKLFIREDVIGRINDTNLAGFVAHELGHRIGLANANCAGTIMQNVDGQSGALVMTQTTVSAQDVSQSRVNYIADLRKTCARLDAQINYLDSDGDAGGSCMDVDGDGVTDCAGDCDDNDFSHSYDCGGGDGVVGEVGSCNPALYQECLNVDGARWNEPTCQCIGYPSPVLLDPSGDGFNLTSAGAGVRFDLDSDGAPERVAWTSAESDDAWLTLDRDGDGAINNGRELFGNYTPQPEPPAGQQRNGFLALAEFDRAENGGDGDGVIDSVDDVYSRLRLWQDVNHDGVSQPSELRALPSLDVARVRLDYKESKRTDGHGNRFLYRAKIDDAKGGKVNRRAWDVFLVSGR